MPYGMTAKQIKQLSSELSDLLEIDVQKVELALDEITRNEVMRIAKNEKEKIDD